jgi:hypothetical protein
MILIGCELEVSSSFSFIRRNAASVRKADCTARSEKAKILFE